MAILHMCVTIFTPLRTFNVVCPLYVTPTHAAVTVSLNTTGSPLSGVEGEVLQVCVYISQDADGGRQCPFNVTLSSHFNGTKPGK